MDAGRDEQAAALAWLRAEFPGWRFIFTDRKRWWALCGPLPAERMSEVDVVDADTLPALRTALTKLAAGDGGNQRTR